MKLFLISDNNDTAEGMRLAGIEGVVVHDEAALSHELDTAVADPDIAVVLMTEKAMNLDSEKVYGYKLSLPRPLIVEIPDRHATSKISENIARYVKDALGVSL